MAGRQYRRESSGPLTSLTIVLRLNVRERSILKHEAQTRNISECGVARMLLERVLQDDLVNAVLDE